MKLSEAIANYDYDKRPYIINPDFELSLIYTYRYDVFMWVNADGKAIENTLSISGYEELHASKNLLNSEGWTYTDPRPRMVLPHTKKRIERYLSNTNDKPSEILKKIYTMLEPHLYGEHITQNSKYPVVLWTDEIKKYGDGHIEMVFNSSDQ